MHDGLPFLQTQAADGPLPQYDLSPHRCNRTLYNVPLAERIDGHLHKVSHEAYSQLDSAGCRPHRHNAAGPAKSEQKANSDP